MKFLFSSNYLGSNLGEGTIATLYQLTRNDIGDGIGGYDEKSSPYLAIKKHFPYELKPFSNSKENRWLLNFVEINKRNFWLLLLSCVTIFLFLQNKTLQSSISVEFKFFIKICLVGIVINAFVTGAMANVLDRLQARVSWLIPMIAFLLLFNYALPKIKARWEGKKKA